jgi:hypothetical protein
VQREDDRDRAIDRALRQTLKASMSATGEHVDGETLAAWAEGQLRPDAAARVEDHASTCAQCQQMLAAFARTAPPPTVAEPLWRRWHLQWLVPIATAATVAAIWIAIPRDERARAVAPLPEQARAAAPQPTAPTAAEEPPREEASARLQQAKPSALTDTASPNQGVRPLAKSTALAPNAKREEFERRDAQDQFATRQADAAPQAPSAPANGQAGARERDADRPPALQEAITIAPRAAAPPPAPAAAPTPPSANAATAAGAAVATPARRGVLGNAPLLTARASAAPPEIRSPDPASRWRIVDQGRRVERSTDKGAQWETAALSSPAVLTIGWSPSPTVCWLVGQAGAVYVTTDGLRFTRVKFPESIDLLSITATDDRHATVMSLDGRSFRTDDGGVTWTR